MRWLLKLNGDLVLTRPVYGEIIIRPYGSHVNRLRHVIYHNQLRATVRTDEEAKQVAKRLLRIP